MDLFRHLLVQAWKAAGQKLKANGVLREVLSFCLPLLQNKKKRLKLTRLKVRFMAGHKLSSFASPPGDICLNVLSLQELMT